MDREWPIMYGEGHGCALPDLAWSIEKIGNRRSLLVGSFGRSKGLGVEVTDLLIDWQRMLTVLNYF